MTQIIAINSASGVQSKAIAERFLSAQWHVRGLSRDAAKFEAIAMTGVEPVIVDDRDVGSLARALDGAEVLVFTPPASDMRDGVREALSERYAKAAVQAGIRRVVVNASEHVIDGAGASAAALKHCEEIFFAAIPETIALEPTVFLDNLTAPWVANFTNDIMSYPKPSHAQVTWISHKTLGDYVVAAAMIRSDTENIWGQRFKIGGADTFDGPALATALGKAISRPLVYEAQSLDAFAANLNTAFGEPTGDRVAETYIWIEKHPGAMRVDDRAEKLFGVTPEPFADWAARQSWPKMPE